MVDSRPDARACGRGGQLLTQEGVNQIFDVDKLNNANFKAVGATAMRIVNGIQQMPAQVQVLAAAAVFMLLADHYKVRPTTATTIVSNLLAQENGRSVQLRAVKRYIENELPR